MNATGGIPQELDALSSPILEDAGLVNAGPMNEDHHQHDDDDAAAVFETLSGATV